MALTSVEVKRDFAMEGGMKNYTCNYINQRRGGNALEAIQLRYLGPSYFSKFVWLEGGGKGG